MVKYLLIFLFSFFLLYIFTCPFPASAEHFTSIEVKEVVNNCDGTFTFTLKVCLGLTDNFGATNEFTLIFSGGTFTRVTSLISSSLNATFKTCDQNCDVVTKSCLGTVLDVATVADGIIRAVDQVYFNSGVSNPTGYNFVENDEIAGCILTNPENICVDIQLTTKGYPTQIELTGFENNYIPLNEDDKKIANTPSAPCCQPQITFTSSPASCQGVCNGTSKANVTGMPPAFTYFWSPTGQITETAFDLCLGDHSVQVTDSMGCSNTAQVTILPAVTINLSSVVKNVDCVGGSNGEINLSITNGTSPYIFNWSNAMIDEDPDSLSNGEYFVTVTDANGCVAFRVDSVKEVASISLTLTKTDATCGNNDGTATVTPSGGFEPYSYSWNSQPPQTDSIATGLSVGNFFLTVTDNKGCAAVGSISIKNQNAPVINGNSIDVRCFNGADGMVTILTSQGTPPYDYLWSDGDTNQNLNGKSAGDYTLTVTDQNGCKDIKDFVLAQPPAIEDSLIFSDVTCFGYNDGSINVFAEGGVPGYSYSWSNFQNTSAIGNLGPGDYSVTITDSKGCSLVTNQLIFEPPALVLSTSMNPPDCNGAVNGSITADLSGGTPPYFYLWSDNQFGPVATGLAADHFSVTAWDNNGCTQVQCLTLNEKNAPQISMDIKDAECNGVSDGSIDVTISGGLSPYSYLWSSGEPTEDISGVPAGNYEFTVTDANGCRAFTDCGGVTLDQPTTLEFSIESTDANCGASDGSATVHVIGGLGPYTYSWGPDLNQTDSIATGLSYGNYEVLFKDANGCMGGAGVKILNIGGITVDTSDNKDIRCFGLNNGSINITCTGGLLQPYSYSWSTTATLEDLSSLSKGKYVVTVTDAANCMGVSDSIIISEPEELRVTALKNDITCPQGCDGIVDITPSGGTLIWYWPYYTYSWSSGFNGEDLTGVCADIYSVAIIDYNGCRKDTTIQVIQPPDITASYTFQKPDCGVENGSIAANLSGGTPGYSYIWFTNPQQFGATVLNVGPGFYPIQVLDSRNCLFEDTLMIENDNAPVFSIVVRDSIPCFGDSSGYADVTVTSGVPPYNYLWSRGDETEDLANVKSGIYYLTVTGNNGCSSISRVIFTEPDPLTLSGFSNDTYCKGVATGSIDLSVTQGTSPYAYSWSNDIKIEDPVNISSGLYIVTVTDAKGCKELSAFTVNETFQLSLSTVISNASCNVSNGSITVNPSGVPEGFSYSWNTQPAQTDQTAVNLGTGGYIVTVTSTSGCSAQVNAGVSNISGPTITLLGKNNVSCFKGSDGNISVLVNGEKSPFTISWTNGISIDSLQQVSPGTYSLPLLTAGDYFVVARDPNGCKFVLTETLIQPDDITISKLITQETCPGKKNGSVTVSVTGGVSPFSYSWNTGSVLDELTNLLNNDYYITVTDSMLCSKSDTINVPVGYVLSDSYGVKDANCNLNDGSIVVTPSQGTFPYSFSWNHNPGLDNDTANTLIAGKYFLTVTDNNGCILMDSMTVGNIPTQIVQISNVINVSCKGNSDGSVFLNVNGGIAPFLYSWSNGKTESPMDSLSTGTYTVTVTDQRSCTATSDTLITEPLLLTLTGYFSPSTCTANDGKAWIDVSGGTSPFSYSWDTQPFQSTDTARNIPAGTYMAFVTDAKGCNDSVTIQLSNTNITITIEEKADATCKGKFDGYIVVSADGGASPYSFSWSTFENTDSIANLGKGNYEISVSDVNGCLAFKSIPLLELDSIVLSFQKKTVSCYMGSDGTLQTTAGGGDGNYDYSWSTGDTSALALNLTAGSYSITVNDDNGCVTTDTVTLNQFARIDISTQFKNPSCGESNGKIDVTPSGGAGNYSFSWNTGELVFFVDTLAPGIFSVTITDGNNCSVDTSYALANEAGPVVNLGSDTVICAGNSLTLDAGNPGLSFSWMPGGETTQNISVLQENNYSVQVTDLNGCIGNDIIFVNVDTVLLDAGVDRIQCRDSSILLSADGGVTYLWTPSTGLSDTKIPNPVVTLFQSQTYQVSATDIFGCSATDEITIRVSPESYSISEDQKICKGDVIPLKAVGGESYSWFPAKGLNNSAIPEPQATPDSSVIYHVEITDSNGCKVRDSLQVTVFPLPVADAGSDTTIVKSQTVILKGSGGGVYQWEPADGLSCYDCQQPVASPQNTIAYILTVKTFDLCISKDTVYIYVEEDKGVFVPNIFTPNSDNQNDIFYVRKYLIGYEIINFRFSIFDRWGNKVFSATNPDEGWDGTFHGLPMNAGVFVYTVEITYSNNNTVVKKGNVTLIR
ncbi:MAG: hypothetical protein A3G23_13030 [Bacteroidetes bacterium RIFCSPLOWO2_12_FULL_37_12]|nr:MAG: hypothetical protein A3G23_13030 [Bacteroidetes bacterium RIFCSPLOWO2_12_FULL_37_12]